MKTFSARKGIVEHGFGTLRLWGQDEFLLPGRANVRGEFSRSAAGYNRRRVWNRRTVPALLATVRQLAGAAAKTTPKVPPPAATGAGGVVVARPLAWAAPQRCSDRGRRAGAALWPPRWKGVPGAYPGTPPRPLHRCRSFHTVCEAGC